MPPSAFISYSRREAPFVDAILDALERRGVEVWVDYYSLVPARPWWEQVLEGIQASEVFLLVVSKDSMASRTVSQEYQYALEKKKRIILILREAVPLPSVLQGREWVDFRGSFGRARRRLARQLDVPMEQRPAPQTGFKTSFSVWLAVLLSVAALVISVPAWWTIYIPIVLVPLPIRILRRDFHYYRVRFALLTLPVALLISWIFLSSFPLLQPIGLYCLLASLAVCPYLILLLSSQGIRVWAKPIASAPRFASAFHPKVKKPESVPFFVEHAPEDKPYADAIAKGLRKYGHAQVMTAGEAQVDLVLISQYKISTLINAERRVVIPIMIQDVDVSDAMIRRIQWIDFRRGIRHLDSLGKLLPDPTELLKVFGAAPLSEQSLYPRMVQLVDYFLLVLGMLSVAAWVPLMLGLGVQSSRIPDPRTFLTLNTLVSGLILLITLFTRRALLNRAGRLASLRRLLWSILGIGALGVGQAAYIIANVLPGMDAAGAITYALEQDMRAWVILGFPIAYLAGLIVIALFGIWNWGHLVRWFPAQVIKT